MEIADGIHRFGSRLVNWYVVERGGRLTVVDAGFAGHWEQLLAALELLGRRLDDVEAVVLTHAHVDHVGFAERVRTTAHARVQAHRADAAPRTRKLPPPYLYLLPSSWPFAVHALRMGMLSTPPVARPSAFDDGDKLDVPGGPVVVHTPGHTAGSCSLHLPDAGAVFTGDTLVTLDPYRSATGPRLMIDQVNEDTEQAAASLDRLERVPADLVLPGHGDPWTGGTAAAVAAARATR